IDASFDRSRPEVLGRVNLIAVDAASLDLITRATAEGRLPNFGRILDAGAVRHLATLHPTSAEAVWAAVATGKLPQKNGVRSSAVYPPELQLEAMAALEGAMSDTPVLTASIGSQAGLGLEARDEAPARIDGVYDRIARAMARARPPQVALMRFQSLDAIGHYFL